MARSNTKPVIARAMHIELGFILFSFLWTTSQATTSTTHTTEILSCPSLQARGTYSNCAPPGALSTYRQLTTPWPLTTTSDGTSTTTPKPTHLPPGVQTSHGGLLNGGGPMRGGGHRYHHSPVRFWWHEHDITTSESLTRPTTHTRANTAPTMPSKVDRALGMGVVSPKSVVTSHWISQHYTGGLLNGDHLIGGGGHCPNRPGRLTMYERALTTHETPNTSLAAIPSMSGTSLHPQMTTSFDTNGTPVVSIYQRCVEWTTRTVVGAGVGGGADGDGDDKLTTISYCLVMTTTTTSSSTSPTDLAEGEANTQAPTSTIGQNTTTTGPSTSVFTTTSSTTQTGNSVGAQFHEPEPEQNPQTTVPISNTFTTVEEGVLIVDVTVIAIVTEITTCLSFIPGGVAHSSGTQDILTVSSGDIPLPYVPAGTSTQQGVFTNVSVAQSTSVQSWSYGGATVTTPDNGIVTAPPVGCKEGLNTPSAARAITEPYRQILPDVLNFTAIGLCYSQPACRDFFRPIQNCFDENAPWRDPYNVHQSRDFQNCVCGTKEGSPFTFGSRLWLDWAKCSDCLKFPGNVLANLVRNEDAAILSFCSAAEPYAFLFITELQNFLLGMWPGVEPIAVFAGPVTTMYQALITSWSTRPPLANVAFGSSVVEFMYADRNGHTPLMATWTTTTTASGSPYSVETITGTSIATWSSMLTPESPSDGPAVHNPLLNSMMEAFGDANATASTTLLSAGSKEGVTILFLVLLFLDLLCASLL